MRKLLLFIVFCVPGSLLSQNVQWKEVAPKLLAASPEFDGAAYFRDGMIWVGVNELWSSADTGKTWTKVPFTQSSSIRDIYFIDRMHGLVATGDRGAFLTRNGGQTWERIAFGEIGQVAFGSSPNIIYFLQRSPSTFYVSSDGALSFNGTEFNGSGNGFCIARNGTIRVLSYSNTQSLLSESTDGGMTWLKDLASNDPDSWSIAADSCDPQRIYRLNEDWAWTYDYLSEVLLSTDGGRAWRTITQEPTLYFAGGLVTTELSLFATTVDNHGVRSSSDRGLTWQDLGGPSTGRDTRSICAVDDSTVFVVSIDGSVWGLYPTVRNTSKEVLFARDTLTPCDDVLTQTITRRSNGCSSNSIVNAQVVGSSAYEVDVIASDSVVVSFKHTKDQDTDGILVLTYSNGRRDTMPLMGTINGSRFEITAVTEDKQTDTIGGMVEVPIALSTLDTPSDVEVTLHYEPAELLIYKGSFDPVSGAQLDIVGEAFPGRAKLSIPNVANANVEAYAVFDVFADSSVVRPKVWFDSFVVIGAEPCRYDLPQVIVSFISPPNGCGISALSQFMRTGKFDFSINPNPARNAITILAPVAIEDAILEIYDALGGQVYAARMSITANQPIQIGTGDLAAGLYFVRIHGSGLRATHSVTIHR